MQEKIKRLIEAMSYLEVISKPDKSCKISDELWEIIEPLLPPEPSKPKAGRPRIPSRAALAEIIFVPKTGLPGEMLPPEMGCGSGITCWRRLRDWQEAGVWENLHQLLLAGGRSSCLS
jgi:transposase